MIYFLPYLFCVHKFLCKLLNVKHLQESKDCFLIPRHQMSQPHRWCRQPTGVKQASANYTSLETIFLLASLPPYLTRVAFSNYNATLYVPKGAAEAYREASVWSIFRMIVEIGAADMYSCPNDNHLHAIDLGQPSGTKWTCCNVGADKPEGYGGYYAWGETEEKEIYDWITYIHFDGSMETCHDLGSDISGTKYDVAHVLWGGSLVMPLVQQIDELVQNCTFTWTTMNGIEGGQFTGLNGDELFLPAADIRWNGFLECSISGGYYWTSTQSPYPGDAYRLCFDSWGGSCGGDNRSHGLTVRPVIGVTNDMIHPKSSAGDTCQAVFSICGIKVADTIADMNVLPPGIYIVNDKKMFIK